MPNRLRTAYANAAAARYAPRPNGSLILYGLISATLLFLGAIVAGAFYSVDVMAYPCYLVGALAAAFIFGAGLRMWRQRAHSAAVDVEFAKRRLSSVKVNVLAPAGSISPAVSPPLDETVEAVTFKSPFLLPGLDRPHAPGTFEVLIQREALDVSWHAFREHHTILLTDGGSVEAMAVSKDDLAAALRRDAGG